MTYNERFALATHFYVSLRRHLNRVIDAVWMAENAEYAAEVLRLARGHGHPELQTLADRYEALGGSAPIKVAVPPPRPPAEDVERLVARHYTGALR